AGPENGVENCGLKKVETAGPMIAADMMTAPASPTELDLRLACKGVPASVSAIITSLMYSLILFEAESVSYAYHKQF
ncbi:MAG: hypothetical protein KGQ26_10710, partial [Rhodospirillales bacterium]|nr:hypothetical protein [Rhodospirillales bacterium]